MTDSKLASLGVCYYPEHWPREQWAEQATQMADAGILLVRIAEFAWSRIEPSRGQFDWAWLDEAVDVLANASLQIIMCTPTACPPRWLINEHPDILPIDEDGKLRDFGSRKHYRFASETYREESQRISAQVIERYAAHPAVVGWQTDNEYGCHSTVLSYAEGDKRAFQHWLEQRYTDVESLNRAWGTVFWSQEYPGFGDVGLPNLTATEANPAHRLDYWRFASDQVRDFNAQQVKLIRESRGGDRWITHNFMGNFIEFDHFDVGEDIDVASWDSYPLGFLDQGWFSDEEKDRYRQIGHPDWAAFHHDLYRAVGRGRLAVMEQQPGPVNWAPSNALPVNNAPAFWGMEAVAHGAEFVSYFRFQQMPRAQEQLHAALRLPNGAPAPAWGPICTLGQQLDALPAQDMQAAPIALIFDYPSCWATEIQAHASGMDTLSTALHYYSVLRQLGQDVDIVSPQAELEGYELVVIPGSVFIDEALTARVRAAGAHCLIGPRSGSREPDGSLPDMLPPGALQTLLGVRVIAIDSMRAGAVREFTFSGDRFCVSRWFEVIESELTPKVLCDDGHGLWYQEDKYHYLNGHVSEDFLRMVLRTVLEDRGLAIDTLPAGLRQRRRGALRFLFNFSPATQTVSLPKARRIVGEEMLKQGDYAVWIDE